MVKVMYNHQLVYKVVIWAFLGINLWTENVDLKVGCCWQYNRWLFPIIYFKCEMIFNVNECMIEQYMNQIVASVNLQQSIKSASNVYYVIKTLRTRLIFLCKTNSLVLVMKHITVRWREVVICERTIVSAHWLKHVNCIDSLSVEGITI